MVYNGIMDTDLSHDVELILLNAYRLLSHRSHSEHELGQKLVRYGARKKIDHLPEIIDQVIERLREQGYLNDKKFAEWFVSQRKEFRPRSKRRLSLELKQKGISEEIIENVLKEYDEKLVLQKLIEKKKAFYTKEELIKYLLNQGFTYDLIQRQIDKIT